MSALPTPHGGSAEHGTAALVESATQLLEATPSGRAGSVLPVVLSEVPVAILLIDLTSRQVTYANRSAVEMAADERLPTPLDAWGAAAGLTDLAGKPLADTASPLSRLATGSPVAGEAVLAPEDGDGTRTLWVTGFPLSASGAEEQLALMVLLEIVAPRSDDREEQLALQLLRDRAIIATDLAFTITDPRRAENPLVWVNPAFTRVTGYGGEEVQGRNCRFLQGPATDRAVVDELRTAIAEGRPITRTLLNYRKDGTAFWNQVAISPVYDGDDQLVSFVGVQTDVTERVRAETEREQAYAAERTARHDAEYSRLRLALLAEASVLLGSTLDQSETVDRLADLLVPALADWVLIRLTDEQGEVVRTIGRHRNGHEALLHQVAERTRRGLDADAAVRQVIAEGAPQLLADADPDLLRQGLADDDVLALAGQLGLHSLMWVPLVARRRRILGAITLVSGPSGRVFTPDDLDVAAEVGRRAGLTFDNARLYQREHEVAETLQRSLLPELPEVDGLAVATAYLPGDAEADVGGDWYEVLPLPDGSVGLAVGDVVGHDLAAAAAMGHLRGLLRACAWNTIDAGDGDPGVVLERVDRLMQGLHVVPLATLLFGRLQRPTDPSAPWRFSYASAGHPPLVLRSPDGTVRLLDDANDVLLGVGTALRRSSTTLLAPGSVLVGYTDGLVERRDEPIDAGLARLVAAVADADVTDLDATLEQIIASGGPDRSDDTAVLIVQVQPGG